MQIRPTLIYGQSHGILSLPVAQTGVEIRVDLENCKIKGTCSTVGFSVMTHNNKNVGRQKISPHTKLQLDTKNPLITTCPNRCEIWVFLIFLETGPSYGADSADQNYRQPLNPHFLFRPFFHYLNPISNRCENRCLKQGFLIFLGTCWPHLKKSGGQIVDI